MLPHLKRCQNNSSNDKRDFMVCQPCHTKSNFLGRASFCSTTSWGEIKTSLWNSKWPLLKGSSTWTWRDSRRKIFRSSKFELAARARKRVHCSPHKLDIIILSFLSKDKFKNFIEVQSDDRWWWFQWYIDQSHQLGAFLLKGPNSTLTAGTTFDLAGRLCAKPIINQSDHLCSIRAVKLPFRYHDLHQCQYMLTIQYTHPCLDRIDPWAALRIKMSKTMVIFQFCWQIVQLTGQTDQW